MSAQIGMAFVPHIEICAHTLAYVSVPIYTLYIQVSAFVMSSGVQALQALKNSGNLDHGLESQKSSIQINTFLL